MTTNKYQLILLGQRSAHTPALMETVKTRFADVGLTFDEHAELLEGAAIYPHWDGFPVAIWFGGDEPPNLAEVTLVDEFLARGFSVFPVVPSLANLAATIPANLHPINGQEFNPSKIASDVMAAFRLARRYRQAFISYKRDEGSAVAAQLFHELTGRGYRVFLDTVSVEAGANFQKSLWSRMADVDLLVLLDSPNALSSEWVHKELLRAHDLGMGVVQLIWPNHKRTAGTELSTAVALTDRDFENGLSQPGNLLTTTMLATVVDTVESERIRSLNARRTRLVDGILSTIAGKGVTLQIHPARQVDVMRGADKLAQIVPFVGVPDSIAVYENEQSQEHKHTFVVYNGLGVDQQWADHLKWLNAKATIHVFQIDDFGDFIGTIA